MNVTYEERNTASAVGLIRWL